MKQLCIAAVACIFLACGSNDEKDSVEMAIEENRSTDSAEMNTVDSLGADKIFLVEAASGGMMEKQLGQYVAANGASAAVKQFARMMVKDHSNADSIITTLAQVKAIAIPNVPGDDHQRHIDELSRKKGAELDKDYMSLMVEDHEEDIRKFEDASKNARDPDVKAFATNTLPILRKHLEQAKKIKDALK